VSDRAASDRLQLSSWDRSSASVAISLAPTAGEHHHWRDHILFYEYFHGDNRGGAGREPPDGMNRGVAKLIQLFGMLDARKMGSSPESVR
jgi:hypothetical protein